jgi:hypothetical protein
VEPPIKAVQARFPHALERAMRLYELDDNFRDVCSEYEVCARSLARLESDATSSTPLRLEYAALLQRLERELSRYLERPNGHDS